MWCLYSLFPGSSPVVVYNTRSLVTLLCWTSFVGHWIIVFEYETYWAQKLIVSIVSISIHLLHLVSCTPCVLTGSPGVRESIPANPSDGETGCQLIWRGDRQPHTRIIIHLSETPINLSCMLLHCGRRREASMARREHATSSQRGADESTSTVPLSPTHHRLCMQCVFTCQKLILCSPL